MGGAVKIRERMKKPFWWRCLVGWHWWLPLTYASVADHPLRFCLNCSRVQQHDGNGWTSKFKVSQRRKVSVLYGIHKDLSA